MPNNIHEAKRDGAFTWADDVADADRECGKRRSIRPMRCAACKRSVMVHCDECRIQVTGCLCTLIERMEPMEAYKTLARQVGQDAARREFQRLGYHMPIIPGIPL